MLMGNMKWILGSDWLPEQARRAHLAHLQLSALIPRKEKKVLWSRPTKFITFGQCLRWSKRDWRWAKQMKHRGLSQIWRATNAEKNLANIQSSLHHAWSIMLIYNIKWNHFSQVFPPDLLHSHIIVSCSAKLNLSFNCSQMSSIFPF